MVYFLTSSPFGAGSPDLNPENGFVDALRQALPNGQPALFVCSSPDKPALTDHFARDMENALIRAGFAFSAFRVLDGRNEEETARLARRAGLVVLAGGHVPTQNAFFQKIHLRQALEAFHGVLIGISAGSMNCCDPVYAQPEEPGEAIDAGYRRFLPGLNVTKTMLLPHYQQVKDSRVDGLRLFADITLPDSRGRTFYAVPDGSFLLGRNGRETLYGEAWRIHNGAMEKISENGGVCPPTEGE